MTGLNHFMKKDNMVAYAKMKGIKSAGPAVLFSGALLVIGGIGTILGVFPDVALALIILFLIPVSFKMHNFWKETDPERKMSEQINFMKNMALVGASTMLFFLSHWPISL